MGLGPAQFEKYTFHENHLFARQKLSKDSMKGLFVNIPNAIKAIQTFDVALGTESTLDYVRVGKHEIVANNSAEDWPQGCVYEDKAVALTVVAAGWLIFRGKFGNLSELASAIGNTSSDSQVDHLLSEIDAGAFIIFIRRGVDFSIITDPFGLHPHYCLDGAPLKGMAPSPTFLSKGLKPDALRVSILSKMNHLFGNYTTYARIERLEPGSVNMGARHRRYFDYSPQEVTGVEIIAALRQTLSLFRERKKILPISGGLDSRLILACGEYEYGYTFGPKETGDRPIARQFSGHFQKYLEFSLLDMKYNEKVRDAGVKMFDGVCEKPFVELLAVYKFLFDQWGKNCLFFDGYIGDVFTRGTFLKYGGFMGSIEKLFPLITKVRFDALRMLRKRYAKLNDQEFGLLKGIYEEKIGHLKLSEPRKALLFDILYGRASRYAINGGTILSRQYFSPVQPFMIPIVFRKVFGIDPYEAMSYQTVPKLWRHLDDPLMQALTYSGFKPMWNPHLSRMAVLVTKGLGRFNVIKKAVQFDRELQHIRWQ